MELCGDGIYLAVYIYLSGWSYSLDEVVVDSGAYAMRLSFVVAIDLGSVQWMWRHPGACVD